MKDEDLRLLDRWCFYAVSDSIWTAFVRLAHVRAWRLRKEARR